jgi:hypothetical protein
MGLFYPVRNSRFGQLVLQMMNPTHVSSPQFFERG